MRNIYTKSAKVVAAGAVLFGFMIFIMGISVANGWVVEPEQGAYLGSKTSGQTIDKGILYMVAGIIIGTLAEISESLSNKRDE